MDERLKVFEEKMEKSFQNLMEEFTSIRAGRANPHILDKLRVDYYGSPVPDPTGCKCFYSGGSKTNADLNHGKL